ncbi:MAG: helix-turn-helix domain-containing protein [Microbacterium sp. 14-71-5]|nr:helix-turn-helix domain-containing protein [Microbacterium sp. 13-71-7]OZB78172.1 MAG: helix-turn-helix domain-containing protein [Microbacterium sp. 14-71-5]OZB85383.1 MAG: helix-turn-helix domain-containing protein [Microbacterium sp. 13-71-7]
MGDRILFVDDVAERLRRSSAQVRWMIQNGTAPRHAKIAGRVCFRESDVEAYIEAAFAEAG